MKTKATTDIAPALSGQHTPGPWQYEGTMNGKDLTIARVFEDQAKTELALNGGRGYVATVHTWATGYCIKDTEAERNARLIAAAPELLQVLQDAACELIYAAEVLLNTPNLTDYARRRGALARDTGEAAKAVIAKAEGRTA